jgi:hypothetical protein
MKIRNGFVSNSSSSSFVVFSPSLIYEIPMLLKHQKDQKTLKIPQTFGGEYEFGRQRQNYTDFGSRLNWAIIHALSIKKCWDEKDEKERNYIPSVYEGENLKFLEKYSNCLDLIYEVLKENIKVENIKNNILYYNSPYQKIDEDEFCEGYIDHGSSWHEREQNIIDIFGEEPNKESIFEWLFNPGNYVANRSDEYEDASSLEVDHRYDYQDSDDFYNPYRNPELFTENEEWKENDDN